MKATFCCGLICECGFAMMNGNYPDHYSAMCVNDQCKHFGKKFSVPTVELKEAQSEWEALIAQ